MVHSIFTYNSTKLLTQQEKFLFIKPIKSNEIKRGIRAFRAFCSGFSKFYVSNIKFITSKICRLTFKIYNV